MRRHIAGRFALRHPRAFLWRGLLVLWLSLAMLPLRQEPIRAFSPVRPILAWYYGWYVLPPNGAPNWVNTADLPPELYDSYDDATMRRQIRQAKAAGIDGFICTWRYNCPRLLDLAAEEGDFGVAISIDPVATSMPSFEAVVAVLQEVRQITTHPAYLRWDGRPVIVFWGNHILPQDSSVDGFRRLRDTSDPNRAQFWLGGGDDFRYLDIFDAIQFFDISWESSPGRAMASYAAKLSAYNASHATRKPFIATVMPGYDDRAVRGGRARDRENGAYYRATWDAALRYQPEAIIITSWNEWYEGSQIEPSRSYGTLYLEITREKAQQYRLSSAGIGDSAFLAVWARTDRPVLEGRVSQSWIWGFPLTGGRYERYGGGERLVQYFDKGRMEVNDPTADRSSPWFVTSGLLTRELITGQLQLGPDQFEKRAPATIPIAGDVDDPNAPTYATFAGLLNRPPRTVGEEITEVVDRSGRVGPGGPGGVVAAYFVPETGHTIAAPFWDFLNSTGTVMQDGRLRQAKLFDPTFFVTGLPITEAYWARVRVSGQERWVLIQAFERRVLTYTPDNPPGWQVEMGNIGLHYYAWRYGAPGG